ncbi:RNA1 polyprotein [Dirofilaria immitis]
MLFLHLNAILPHAATNTVCEVIVAYMLLLVGFLRLYDVKKITRYRILWMVLSPWSQYTNLLGSKFFRRRILFSSTGMAFGFELENEKKSFHNLHIECINLLNKDMIVRTLSAMSGKLDNKDCTNIERSMVKFG